MGKVYKPYTREDFASDLDALKPIFYISVTIGSIVTGLVLTQDQQKKNQAEIAVVNDLDLNPVIVQAGVGYEIK